MKALFVCVGNACRSPMAEGLFNFESMKRNNNYEAQSAGVRPYTHVINESVGIMNELGIDISNHEPKNLSLELLNWADKVVLLDNHIKDGLSNLPSIIKDKMIVWDIEDPYKTSQDNFRKVRNMIHKKILELLDN